MHFVACIKQVPDAEHLVIDPVRKTLRRDLAKAVTNPPDENTVETALYLKAKVGGKVTVVTMGPPQAEAMLREMVARGADEAILISDRVFAGADTYPTSLTLAAAIRKLGDVDLILCGEETTDSSTAQVGPGIAEHLGIPQAAWVSEVGYLPKRGAFRVRRILEGGYEVLELNPPALITCTLNMNIPRVGSLRGKLRSREYKVPVWDAAMVGLPPEWLGLKGSPTRVAKVVTEESEDRSCERLAGTPSEAAAALVAALGKKGVVL